MTGAYQAINDLRAGRCKYPGCDSPVILWAITANGKRMPLNPGPDLEGNVALELRPGNSLDVATVLGDLELYAARAAGEALYTPHFATCKGRQNQRKSRK